MMTKRTEPNEQSTSQKSDKDCAAQTPPAPSSSEKPDSLYDDMSIPVEKRVRLKEERAMANGGK